MYDKNSPPIYNTDSRDTSEIEVIATRHLMVWMNLISSSLITLCPWDFVFGWFWGWYWASEAKLTPCIHGPLIYCNFHAPAILESK